MKWRSHTADIVTAVEMAQRAGIDEKLFRAELRKADLRWHQRNARWLAIRGSAEHQDMHRVLSSLAARRDSN